MKALVVGCGILGRRHTNNLLKIDAIERIFIFTKVKDCLEHLDRQKNITIIESIDDIDVDVAIIANETSKHLDAAITLAEQNIHLFIEKPLSHNLTRLDELKTLVERNKIKIFVAYNLRFLGVMGYLKQQISERAIGSLYFAKIEVGQYLPSWRPGKDYRGFYSANRAKGGGVALDLSHEVDYMRYLFGDPCSWKVVTTKVSDLEIDSDDLFEGLFQYKSGFICNVHADYLQKETQREIRIVGSEGILFCDFIGRNIRVQGSDSRHTCQRTDSNINADRLFNTGKTYMDELTHFVDVVKNDGNPSITLDDGIKVLQLLKDGGK